MAIIRNKNNEIRSGWTITLVYLLVVLTYIITFFVGITSVLIYIGTKYGAELGADIFGNIYEFLINRSEIFNIVLMSFGNSLYMIFAIILWRKYKKKSLSKMGITKLKNNKRDFVKGLILGAIAITLIAIILLTFGDVKLDRSLLEPKFSLDSILGLIGFVFVGFGEEIFARGFAMSMLKQTNNKWIVLFVSSLLFAISHVVNPGVTVLPIVNLFLIGILLGIMFMKTKNIWMGVGFHITWNYFQGYIWGFQVTGSGVNGVYIIDELKSNILNGGNFGPEGGLVVTVVSIALIAFLLYIFRHKSIESFMEDELQEQAIDEQKSII